MLISILLIFITIINGIKNEDKTFEDKVLDISHPYEMLNFDRSILTDIKTHRKRRSIDNNELEKRWKRDLEREKSNGDFDNYERHLEKHDALHMYTKLPDSEFKSTKNKSPDEKPSDDDQFNERKEFNKFKQKHLDDNDQHFKLNFNAHNRKFKLRLKGKTSFDEVFAPDIEFESTNGKFHYDKDNIINGFVEGEKGSSIEGIITHDGLIDGIVHSEDNEDYYIEPLRNYLKHDKLDDETFKDKTKNFHSIIYKLSDLTFPNVTCKHKHPHEEYSMHHLHKRETKSMSYQNGTSSIKSNLIEPDLLNSKYLQTARKNSMTNKSSIKKQNKTQNSNSNRKNYWNRPVSLNAIRVMRE